MANQLVWDKTAERFYETGVNQVVLYPRSNIGTYPKGVVWNGMTTLTESPSGAEPNPFYADNMKYLNLQSIEEFGGTIEAFTYPHEFEKCDGSAEPTPGVLIGQQPRQEFGLCYKTLLGNDVVNTGLGYKLHFVWGALASPSEKARATVNETPEPLTFSWEFSTTPIPTTGFQPISYMVLDSTKVDPDLLTALEIILYGVAGTPGTDARLPLPAELIDLMTPEG